jgi:hypothetical protein
MSFSCSNFRYETHFLLCKTFKFGVGFSKSRRIQKKISKRKKQCVTVKEVDVYVQFHKTISTSSSGKYNRRPITTTQASVSED